MDNKDTVLLLRECDAGSKMAVSSIEDVLDVIKISELKAVMEKSKQHHEKLGNEIHALLNYYGEEEKDPNIMAKSMSWLKTNWKMIMEGNDATIADLMTDGCDMGIKSLYQYMNRYSNANEKAKKLCADLIEIEESLRKSLQCYL